MELRLVITLNIGT